MRLYLDLKKQNKQKSWPHLSLRCNNALKPTNTYICECIGIKTQTQTNVNENFHTQFP